jgi:hypothetical protein
MRRIRDGWTLVSRRLQILIDGESFFGTEST